MGFIEFYKEISDNIANIYNRDVNIASTSQDMLDSFANYKFLSRKPDEFAFYATLRNFYTKFKTRNLSDPQQLKIIVTVLQNFYLDKFGYSDINDFLYDNNISVKRDFATISGMTDVGFPINDENLEIVEEKIIWGHFLGDADQIVSYSDSYGATSYMYFLCTGGASRYGLSEEYDEINDKWLKLENILQKAFVANLKIWVGFYNPIAFQASTDVLEQKMLYKDWIYSLAKLSKIYPNFQGVIIDDWGENNFWTDNAHLWVDSNGDNIFTENYMSELQTLIKSENSKFKFVPVLYFYNIFKYPGAIADESTVENEEYSKRLPYLDGVCFVYRHDKSYNDSIAGDYDLYRIDSLEQEIRDVRGTLSSEQFILPLIYGRRTSWSYDSFGLPYNPEPYYIEYGIRTCLAKTSKCIVWYLVQDENVFNGVIDYYDSRSYDLNYRLNSGIATWKAFTTDSYFFTSISKTGPMLVPLYEHIDRSMTARLTGESPITTPPFFSAIYHGDTKPTGDPRGYTYQEIETSSYTRNINCWLNGLKGINSMSVYNWRHVSVVGTTARHGIMISPRHIVTANHVVWNVGQRIRFVLSDNTPVEYILEDVLYGSYSSNPYINYQDVAIGQFSEDLPDDIGFVKILPSNVGEYISGDHLSGGDSPEIPIIGILGGTSTFKDKHASVRLSKNIGTSYNGMNFVRFSSDALYDSFYVGNVISGNSGAPILVSIGNELVLLSTFSASTGGPVYHNLITYLNDAMDFMGSDYRVSEFDLATYFKKV